MAGPRPVSPTSGRLYPSPQAQQQQQKEAALRRTITELIGRNNTVEEENQKLKDNITTGLVVGTVAVLGAAIVTGLAVHPTALATLTGAIAGGWSKLTSIFASNVCPTGQHYQGNVCVPDVTTPTPTPTPPPTV